jgi:hypothetical protein
MGNSINKLLEQASDNAIEQAAHELMSWVESHAVMTEMRQQHINALFCLNCAVKYRNISRVVTVMWFTSGCKYAKNAGVSDSKIAFSLNLLGNDSNRGTSL